MICLESLKNVYEGNNSSFGRESSSGYKLIMKIQKKKYKN